MKGLHGRVGASERRSTTARPQNHRKICNLRVHRHHRCFSLGPDPLRLPRIRRVTMTGRSKALIAVVALAGALALPGVVKPQVVVQPSPPPPVVVEPSPPPPVVVKPTPPPTVVVE